jgi:ElaB/YqjD/DUF883 family membrane-anchored ribosome-binding protein
MGETRNATRTSTRQESDSGDETSEQIREAGKEIMQKAQDLTTQGKEVATEYYQQSRQQVLAWQQQLENHVREKPIQSLLIAAGVGLLFGLLRRR